jgi:putative glycosyltransferase (TIGR04348 family)
VERYRAARPGGPLVLALTGTDVYGSLHTHAAARRAVGRADRLVVLQPLALAELRAQARAKARVLYQSVPAPRRKPAPRKDTFEVCVLGHLRPVKDPFRAARAARRLPASSRVRVLHLGAALTDGMAERARAEAAANPRYRWLGGVPRPRALRVLARCRLLVQSSRAEGGANAVSEALAASVPVLASRIPGSVGLLGKGYPGYFPAGDTAALAGLLARAEADPAFYRGLRAWCARLRPLVDPARERRGWEDLLRELKR